MRLFVGLRREKYEREISKNTGRAWKASHSDEFSLNLHSEFYGACENVKTTYESFRN